MTIAPTALVTGASSGLGLSFARQLAARGYHLVAVARNVARLEETAEAIRTAYGVEVETIPADLADREQAQRVAERLADPERPVDLLVNNAGHGLHHKLTDIDTRPHEQAMDLMIRAVLMLGAAAGRSMRERGSGAIINVASVAATVPMGSYSAIKAWVRSYSDGLALELEGTGVRVLTLMPGWVRTEFHDRAGISTRSLPEPLWLDPETVVSEALDDLAAGHSSSTPSLLYKAVSFGTKHLPSAIIRQGVRRINGDRDKAKLKMPHLPHLPDSMKDRMHLPDSMRSTMRRGDRHE